MKNVVGSDIREGFEKMGIIGKRVLIHSSLRSLGYVEGGADAVLSVIVNNFKTILMPAFCWDSNAVPPVGDRPAQNGCYYSFYDNWNKSPTPFIIESAGIEKSMGVISRKFVAMPKVYRSDHAWHSWAAYGDMAEQLTANHIWESTNLPVARLADIGGFMILLGVGLTSCTPIHVAEEQAGRKPFIRWMVDRNGKVRRVRAAGCARGFDNLIPYCKGLLTETYIGSCRVLMAPLGSFIEHVTSVIVSNPELTRCSGTCIKCRDAILGGPIERV